jgi:hypothetical protein
VSLPALLRITAVDKPACSWLTSRCVVIRYVTSREAVRDQRLFFLREVIVVFALIPLCSD